jgi:transposase
LFAFYHAGATLFIISDSLWKEIENIIQKNYSFIGRPEWDNRKTLSGIIFIVKTGIPWRFLPSEFGAVSTVHGKFRKWVNQGVFDSIMDKARKFYLRNKKEKSTWFAIDTAHSKAPFANWSGPNPTDRRKRGIKKSIAVDFNGAPMAINVGASNTHDSQFFEETFKQLRDKIPIDKVGIISADSAFDSRKLKKICKNKGFVLLAATNRRRNKNVEVYKPNCRWIVERTFGWLSWFRGIKTCWTKTKESFLAFLQLAASIQLFKMGGVFG